MPLFSLSLLHSVPFSHFSPFFIPSSWQGFSRTDEPGSACSSLKREIKKYDKRGVENELKMSPFLLRSATFLPAFAFGVFFNSDEDALENTHTLPHREEYQVTRNTLIMKTYTHTFTLLLYWYRQHWVWTASCLLSSYKRTHIKTTIMTSYLHKLSALNTHGHTTRKYVFTATSTLMLYDN